MNNLKKHLTPATVISCIALFVALSGSVYAAGLAKNSVKAKNIAKGAVTSPKLKNGAVTAAKIKNGAVIGSKLANESVGASKLASASVRSSALGGGVVTSAKLKDLAVTTAKIGNNAVGKDQIGAGAVETGKLAKEAVTAEKLASGLYAQLVKNVSYETKLAANSSVSPKTAEATCPAGKVAIGGGARVGLDTATDVALLGSEPFAADVQGKRIGWTATAAEVGGDDVGDWSLTAYVVCAEL